MIETILLSSSSSPKYKVGILSNVISSLNDDMPLAVVKVKSLVTTCVFNSVSIRFAFNFLYVIVAVKVPCSIIGVTSLWLFNFIAPENVIVGRLNTVPITADVSIVAILTGLSYNITAVLLFVIYGSANASNISFNL